MLNMIIRYFTSVVLSISTFSIYMAYSLINGKPDIGMLTILSPFLIVGIIVSLVISRIIKSHHGSIVILVLCAITFMVAIIYGAELGMGSYIILRLLLYFAIVPAILSIINIIMKIYISRSITIIILSVSLVIFVYKYMQWIDAYKVDRSDLFLDPIFTIISGGKRSIDQGNK
jgi:hypothetical protein